MPANSPAPGDNRLAAFFNGLGLPPWLGTGLAAPPPAPPRLAPQRAAVAVQDGADEDDERRRDAGAPALGSFADAVRPSAADVKGAARYQFLHEQFAQEFQPRSASEHADVARLAAKHLERERLSREVRRAMRTPLAVDPAVAQAAQHYAQLDRELAVERGLLASLTEGGAPVLPAASAAWVAAALAESAAFVLADLEEADAEEREALLEQATSDAAGGEGGDATAGTSAEQTGESAAHSAEETERRERSRRAFEESEAQELAELRQCGAQLTPARKRLVEARIAAVLTGAETLTRPERRAWTALLERRLKHRSPELRSLKPKYDLYGRACARSFDVMPACTKRLRELQSCERETERAIDHLLKRFGKRRT